MVYYVTLEQMRKQKEKLHLSNEELAQLAGVSVSAVAKIMAGITMHPRYETQAAIEAVLFPKGWPPQDNNAENDEMKESVTKDSEETNPHRLRERAVWEEDSEPQQGSYTLDDFYDWPEEERIELIDGVIYDMGAPTGRHQVTIGWMHYELEDFVRHHGGNCRVMLSPFDVQLDRDERTMLEPDLMIFCQRRPLLNRCYFGAPDFVLEVLSPSTKNRDLGLKLRKYREAGVREYWIIDPEQQRLIVHHFEADDMPRIYTLQDQVPVGIWGGECVLDFRPLSMELLEVKDEFDDIYA